MKALIFAFAALFSAFSDPAHAGDAPFIIVQSTTSTQNSGLYDHILPLFTAQTGIEVRVVAVGTGQAIRNARNGDGDVLLVHAKPAEENFVAEGWGVERFDLMHNDFVLVGPEGDPAAVAGATTIGAALSAILDANAPFASRGDDSGTHKKEMSLWRASSLDPTGDSGNWYRETGSGMGATLNVASGMGAYALTDRATWVKFGNKGDLTILFEGDPVLFNQYGVILVNPSKHGHVKATEGQALIDWLLSEDGQSAIASYMLDGAALFTPSAGPRQAKPAG